MSPISDEQIDRYSYILLNDDATVLDAARALQAADGSDWWCLLVSRADGSYAAGKFSQIARGLHAEGERYLNHRLSELIGGELQEVAVLADQEEVDFDTLLAQAADASCPVAVITRQGEVRGVVMAPTMRHLSTRAAFDAGLVQLAGKYAQLPDKGLLKQSASGGQKKRSKTRRRPRRPRR